MRLVWPVPEMAAVPPHVEVVITCHNYGRFLRSCVDSALEQVGVRVTVLVVDDASSDDSGKIADDLAAEHPEVRVLHNPVNLGIVAAFNAGLDALDPAAAYVVRLDADDLLAPGALARATAAMEADPAVAFVYGHAQKFTTQPFHVRPMPAVSWTRWAGDDWIALQLKRAWNIVAGSDVVMRASVREAVGYFSAELPRTHDLEYWLRMAAHGDVVHINGADQAYYRRHDANHSKTFTVYDDAEERWRAYDRFLSGWDHWAEAERLRPVAQRRISGEILSHLLHGLDAGDLDSVLLDRALDIARRIDPAVVVRSRWRAVNDRRADADSTLPAAARAGVRSLARAAKWTRWRRFRYLG